MVSAGAISTVLRTKCIGLGADSTNEAQRIWVACTEYFVRSRRRLLAVPNFPSYPSNHSTFSSSRAEILAYLFPTRADFIRAVGKEGGDSRIWGGIHFPIDNVAGVNLGKSIAQVFVAWADADGSQ